MGRKAVPQTRADRFDVGAFAFVLSIAAMLSACGGGGDSAPTPPATPQVVSVSVSAPSSTILVGDQEPLTAAVSVLNGASTAVTWSTSNPSVATVSSTGVVQGVSPGSATVTATSTVDAGKSGSISITVNARPAVSAVSIAPASTTMNVGATQALTATVTAIGGASTAVNWTTSNPKIASVSASGVVTGVSAGTATITATSVFDGTRSATAAVTIVQPPPAVLSVAVAPLTSPVPVGAQVTLTATVTVANGASTAVAWSTSNPAVASVSQAGLLTGVAAGTATITATSVFDAGKSSSIQATIIQPPPSVTSVVVTPPTSALVVGGQVALTATVAALNGASTAVTWSTSNPAVATVSPAGLVTGTGVGSVVITATSVFDASKSGSASLTISPAPAVLSVTVSAAPPALIVGTTSQLSAAVSVVGGASDAVTWRSSDPALASVSATGLVTALAPGSVTITATSVFDPSRSATTSPIRLDATALVLSVTVGPATLALTVGQSGQLNATVTVGNNASQQVTWSSDNVGVATVTNTGRVTAVSAGSARIRATAQADATKFAESITTVTAVSFPGQVTVDATTNATFSPQVVDVAVLGTVTFSFKSLAHNVTFDDAGAPGNIPTTSNVNVNRVFNTVGTFTYRCTIHAGMTGTVRVH